jgi:hypothetical protein
MVSEELEEFIEPGSIESWNNAQEFAAILPPINTLFSGCVRTLWPPTASFTPGELVRRFPFDAIFKNASVKSLLYHAAVALGRHDPAEDDQITGLKLVDMFDFRELTSVLMISYLDTALRKLTDESTWKTSAGEIDLHTEVGALIGEAIPAIGVGCGMMVPAIRLFAIALFSRKDLRGYKAYMRELHKNEMLFDLRYEESKWGCNHLQISSILLQICGFGVNAPSGMLLGSEVGHLVKVVAANDEMLAWSHSRQWLEALLQRERAPVGVDEKGKFFPSEEGLNSLQKKIDNLSGKPSTFNWRRKRREDLDPMILGRLSLLSEQGVGGDPDS